MNNPFLRFKRYGLDNLSRAEAKENHATECLAACLVFSPGIRRSFIVFLFGGENAVPPHFLEADGVDVRTQESAGTFGFIDLLLCLPGQFNLVVEIKVDSQEFCAHHQKQLTNYHQWLQHQPEKQGFLFSLVRNEDLRFPYWKYGVEKGRRRTWMTLCEHLRQDPLLSEADGILVDNFIQYLNSEEIMTSFQPSELRAYAAGIKAQKAVSGVFDRVASRLAEDGYTTCPVLRPNDWPRLEVGRPEWDAIFGKGYNGKLWLWFTVPDIWEAKAHTFYTELQIWHKQHGNDWAWTKPKLPKWFEHLSRHRLVTRTDLTWKRAIEALAPEQIAAPPVRIVSYYKNTSEELSVETKVPGMDDLLDSLIDMVKKQSEIVSSMDGA